MGRKPAFTTEQLLAQAVAMAAAKGPGAVTMQGVASAAGAPSGSVYHRFISRPHLLAEVWRDALQTFQDDWQSASLRAVNAGDVAVIPVRWARRKRPLARVLTLYGREDFVGEDAPDDVRDAITKLYRATGHQMTRLADRFLGRTDEEALERTVLALSGIPLATIRPALRSDCPINRHAERLVRQAALCLMENHSHD